MQTSSGAARTKLAIVPRGRILCWQPRCSWTWPSSTSALGTTICGRRDWRDGEDYAAAMAGPITMDPLTLHIDCAGTIATINGPKRNALGAREKKGACLEQAPLLPRRGQCSQGQGPCDGDRRAGWAFHSFVPAWKPFRRCVRPKKGAPTHTSRPCTWPKTVLALSSPGQASCALGSRSASADQIVYFPVCGTFLSCSV